MHDLNGKVAVVTGAARGQGAASAKALAEAGAAVVLGDRDGHGAEQRAAEINSAGGRAIGMKADVRSEADVQAQIQRAVDEYGRLDILHSNAADLEILGEDQGITDFTVELWREQFDTIALGAMLYCKHAIPAMIESGGGGSIVCTSSVSAEMGELNLTVYAAAKARSIR